MTLRFVDRMDVASAEGLSPLQLEQLHVCGQKYDGVPLDLDEAGCERWEVLDADGSPAYQAWLYMADSGTIFKAGTTEVVAEVVQFGVECADPALEAALDEAKDARGTA